MNSDGPRKIKKALFFLFAKQLRNLMSIPSYSAHLHGFGWEGFLRWLLGIALACEVRVMGFRRQSDFM